MINYLGIPRLPVTSSNIASAGYDPLSKCMVIEFNSGAIYAYHDVPKAVYDEFSDADSKGKFFGANIRNTYRYDKVA